MWVCTRCSRWWKIGRSISGLFMAPQLRQRRSVGVAARPTLPPPRVTATEDVHLGADGLPLDDHARLLLARIARRRDADHGGPVGLSGEGLLVGAPFRIARRDQIVMAARPDLGQVRREGHAPVDDDRRPAPAPGALFQARGAGVP